MSKFVLISLFWVLAKIDKIVLGEIVLIDCMLHVQFTLEGPG